MNNILVSFGLIFILVSVGSLIGNFFDMESYTYFPYIIWGVALCIFNLLLEKKHENIFIKEIE
tara:strand:- start:624 stop:812 length:189 start_codon:yes stop_codon:yes gene_type:complete